MQNWNDLIYCFALAEYGPMGKAAKALRTNATTVSRHIQSVSERYNQPIFTKEGQEWRPTAFGEKLVEIEQGIKEDIDSIEPNVATNAQGTLRVFCEIRLMQGFLAPHWPALLNQNPDINLHPTLTPASLAYGEVDMAFTCTEPTERRLVRKRITRTEYGIFARTDFLSNLQGWVELVDDAGGKMDQSYLQNHFDQPARLALQGLNTALKTIQELPYMAMLPRSLAADHPELSEVPNSPVSYDEVWLSIHDSRRNDQLIRSIFNWLYDIPKA